jgi:hypothetical protein
VLIEGEEIEKKDLHSLTFLGRPQRLGASHDNKRPAQWPGE